MGSACSTDGRVSEMLTKFLFGKPEGNRQLGRQRCRWEDNIRMDLMEIGWEGVDWIDVA